MRAHNIIITAPKKNIKSAALNESFGQISSVAALIKLVPRPPIPYPAMIAPIYLGGI